MIFSNVAADERIVSGRLRTYNLFGKVFFDQLIEIPKRKKTTSQNLRSIAGEFRAAECISRRTHLESGLLSLLPARWITELLRNLFGPYARRNIRLTQDKAPDNLIGSI
jgi:hypothetical protein